MNTFFPFTFASGLKADEPRFSPPHLSAIPAVSALLLLLLSHRARLHRLVERVSPLSPTRGKTPGPSRVSAHARAWKCRLQKRQMCKGKKRRGTIWGYIKAMQHISKKREKTCCWLIMIIVVSYPSSKAFRVAIFYLPLTTILWVRR